MKRKLIGLIIIGLLSEINAGLIGSIYDKAKDKTKDKIIETAVDSGKDIYKEKRIIRKENEEKNGKTSNITKAEDAAINTAKTAKQTAINSFGGQENVDYLKRGKGHIGEALKNGLKN